MKKNIKDKLRNNQIVSGCFIGTHSTYLADIAGHIGFDFILIDNEHGAFSWGEVEEMIRAIDTTDSVPFVRVPSSSSVDILKALDRGDRKSTRLNSSHVSISYAVFCLKKKITMNLMNT